MSKWIMLLTQSTETKLLKKLTLLNLYEVVNACKIIETCPLQDSVLKF